MIKLSFIKSNVRKNNIERCLALLKTEIFSGLREARQVVVIPNCMTTKNKSAVTHKDTLDAVLNFIKPAVNHQIILAGGSDSRETFSVFKELGYLELQEKYDFTIADMNNDIYNDINLLGVNGNEQNTQTARTIMDSDYIITLSIPKTDNSTVYSGAIKNVAQNTLPNSGYSIHSKLMSKFNLSKNHKSILFENHKSANQNIYRIYNKLSIKLAVIDAFEAMEGDGPIDGDTVPCHWAIGTTNPIAADCLAATLMGINYKDVGYLAMLEKGDDEYFIAGDDWQRSIKKFKMHSKFEQIKNWE